MHPLVAHERRLWLQEHRQHPVLLLDIPLLYETGAEDMVRQIEHCAQVFTRICH